MEMESDVSRGRGGGGAMLGSVCILCQEKLNHAEGVLAGESGASLKSLFQFLKLDVSKVRLESSEEEGHLSGDGEGCCWTVDEMVASGKICGECDLLVELFGVKYKVFEGALRYMKQSIQKLELRLKLSCDPGATPAPRDNGLAKYCHLKAEIVKMCELKLKSKASDEELPGGLQKQQPDIAQDEVRSKHARKRQSDERSNNGVWTVWRRQMGDVEVEGGDELMNDDFHQEEGQSVDDQMEGAPPMGSNSKLDNNQKNPSSSSGKKLTNNGNQTKSSRPVTREAGGTGKSHDSIEAGVVSMNSLEGGPPPKKLPLAQKPSQINEVQEEPLDLVITRPNTANRLIVKTERMEQSVSNSNVEACAISTVQFPQSQRSNQRNIRKGQGGGNGNSGRVLSAITSQARDCAYCGMPLRGKSSSNLDRHMICMHTIEHVPAVAQLCTDQSAVNNAIADICRDVIQPCPSKRQAYLCTLCGQDRTGNSKYHLLKAHLPTVLSRLGEAVADRAPAPQAPVSNLDESLASSDLHNIKQERTEPPMRTIPPSKRTTTASKTGNPSELNPRQDVSNGAPPRPPLPSSSKSKAAHHVQKPQQQVNDRSEFRSKMGLGFWKCVVIKPPFTRPFLIREAIKESREKQLTEEEICNWLQKNFGYFRTGDVTKLKHQVSQTLSSKPYCYRVDTDTGGAWKLIKKEVKTSSTAWSKTRQV